MQWWCLIMFYCYFLFWVAIWFENLEPAVHATSWADSFVFCPKHMGNVETLRGGPVAQLSEMQLDQTENKIREWIQRRNTKGNFFVLCMFVSSIERACHRGEQRILQKDYGRLGGLGLEKEGSFLYQLRCLNFQNGRIDFVKPRELHWVCPPGYGDAMATW